MVAPALIVCVPPLLIAIAAAALVADVMEQTNPSVPEPDVTVKGTLNAPPVSDAVAGNEAVGAVSIALFRVNVPVNGVLSTRPAVQLALVLVIRSELALKLITYEALAVAAAGVRFTVASKMFAPPETAVPAVYTAPKSAVPVKVIACAANGLKVSA